MLPMDSGIDFKFERDTFSFSNELLWEYSFDPQTGRGTTFRRNPPPTYAHHCFVLVRAALQFFRHGIFDASKPQASDIDYAQIIRRMMKRNPRVECSFEQRIVIPGFDCLRSFSRDREAVLKAKCGGAWQSYFLRSHWRMVFAISRNHQERTAGNLQEHLNGERVAAIHLVRFPQLTINHGMLLYGSETVTDEIRFHAYDPNLPAQRTIVTYRTLERTFHLPANTYWPGGPLDIIEIYRGWLY